MFWVSAFPAFLNYVPNKVLVSVIGQDLVFYSICGQEDPLEKAEATYSSILGWTEEPGGLQFMGSQRVGRDWAPNTFTSAVWDALLQYSGSSKEQKRGGPMDITFQWKSSLLTIMDKVPILLNLTSSWKWQTVACSISKQTNADISGGVVCCQVNYHQPTILLSPTSLPYDNLQSCFPLAPSHRHN